MGLSFKQIIILGVLTVIACIVLGGMTAIGIYWSSFSSADDSFSYFVRVQEENINRNIANAKVIIEVSGEPPLDGVTDTNGIVRIFISNSYSGNPGRLLIEASGYEPYRKEIDVKQGRLPDTVALKPALQIEEPTPTNIASTPTPAPIPTDTPTAFLQSEPINTPSPSPTPQIPTIEPNNNVSGSLAKGAFDDYSFMGTANTPVVFVIQKTDGDFYTRFKLEIYDPNGIKLESTGAFSDFSQPFTPKEDGKYIFRLIGSDSFGNYNLVMKNP